LSAGTSLGDRDDAHRLGAPFLVEQKIDEPLIQRSVAEDEGDLDFDLGVVLDHDDIVGVLSNEEVLTQQECSIFDELAESRGLAVFWITTDDDENDGSQVNFPPTPGGVKNPEEGQSS